MANRSADEHLPAPRRRELTLDDYYQGVLAGDRAVLPRAVTLIESQHPRDQQQAEELLTRLLPHTGQAIRLGLTGPPGVGKSTFIEALGLHLVDQGRKVAVLTIDPSSSISGGSILGDKTRMSRLAAARDAFIRPSPSAGALGGVAGKTRESMLLCEAAGFGVVIVETVGVGQSETMAANMTDCFLGLMMPGAGDELQGIKRGLLELVDLVVVNKADGDRRAAAELAAEQYRSALPLLASHHGDAPQVFTCSALEAKGIAPIWEAIAARQARWLADQRLAERRRRQSLHWLQAAIDERLRAALEADGGVRTLRSHLEREVLAGKLPVAVAARQVLERFLNRERD